MKKCPFCNAVIDPFCADHGYVQDSHGEQYEVSSEDVIYKVFISIRSFDKNFHYAIYQWPTGIIDPNSGQLIFLLESDDKFYPITPNMTKEDLLKRLGVLKTFI